MVTFLDRFWTASAPQVAEQGDQSDHSDQRQSVGKACTTKVGLAVVVLVDIAVSVEMQVLLSLAKNRLGGQVQR